SLPGRPGGDPILHAEWTDSGTHPYHAAPTTGMPSKLAALRTRPTVAAVHVLLIASEPIVFTTSTTLRCPLDKMAQSLAPFLWPDTLVSRPNLVPARSAVREPQVPAHFARHSCCENRPKLSQVPRDVTRRNQAS